MGKDAIVMNPETSVEDIELYTQVPQEPPPPAYSPEPIDPNQLVVLVTLQLGKNGCEKKYDLSFGVDEGANMKTLIEKAMKMIPNGARRFRVRRYHATFQEYVETNTDDPVKHMARYHIRYAAHDEAATLFSPPSTPRQITANSDAKDVQCIDLTDDSPEGSAPDTPSDNGATMPPPSTTVRRKRLSTGDSTPTSTKRARPLLSKPQSDGQSPMPHVQPTMQSPGYQALSGTNAAAKMPPTDGLIQVSTPVGTPYSSLPQQMAQDYPNINQTASVLGTNGATSTTPLSGSPQLSISIGSPYAPQTMAQCYPMMNQNASMTGGINGAVGMNHPTGSPQMAMPTGSLYSPQLTPQSVPMMNHLYSSMPDMNMNYAMPPCAPSTPQPIGPPMMSPSPGAPNEISGPRLLRTASFQPVMGMHRPPCPTNDMPLQPSLYPDPYAASPTRRFAASPLSSPYGYGMAPFGRSSY